MFSITVDASRKVVQARMWGFMSVDEVADFGRQEQQAAKSMGWGSEEFLLLVVTEGAVIQSQEVVAALREFVATCRLKARRVAVVRGSSLTRLQTQRILMVRTDTAIFERLADAEQWLFAPEDGMKAAG